MTLLLQPHVEELVYGWLSAQPELQDLPPRPPGVWTDLPDQFMSLRPLILLQRRGGAPVTHHPLVIDHPIVQFTVWGGSKKEAHLISATVRALITERFGQDVPNAAVDRWGSMLYLPDVINEAGKSIPRYVFDLSLVTKGAA